MTDLRIAVTRTWCGKTRARLTGHTDGLTVDVEVTGWRRAHVLAEAHATFEAVTANPTAPLPRKAHPMLRALLLCTLLLLGLPAVAGAPGHHTFNDAAVLDASQVIDGRDLYGELVCRPGDMVPGGCEIDYHPTSES